MQTKKNDNDRLITIAIFTYEKAVIVKNIFESEGIPCFIQNVNLIQPVISAGVRVRINEKNLPHALKILEERNLTQENKKHKKQEKDQTPIILIPVDFSPYSLRACRVGFQYAETKDAKVVLLHTYFSPYFPGAIPVADGYSYDPEEIESFKIARKTEKREFKIFLDQLKKEIDAHNIPDIPFEHIMQEGIPEEEIRRYIEEQKPILVVMGTRGRDQKEIDLIGSVTAEVIERATVPILAIPENSTFASLSDMGNIAFFTTFDQKELVILDSFMRIMGKNFTNINFLHLATKNGEWDEITLSGFAAYFKKQYPNYISSSTVIDSNDFLVNIENYIRKNNIKLLVISTRKRNIFARLFNPSIAHKMVFHTETPLLVIPGK